METRKANSLDGEDPADLEHAVSRRSFLYSLGALVLGGCGGGEVVQNGMQSSRSLATTVSSSLIHPGLLHTQADFERMTAQLNSEPWKSSWNRLITNSRAQLSYSPRPVAIVYRGLDGVNPDNSVRLFNDIAAAYACALRWRIAGDSAYADKAVQIMDAWSSTLTAMEGHVNDRYLAAGLYGYEFANVGEMMRSYTGWSPANFERFQSMMRGVFYPMNHDFLLNHIGRDPMWQNANWDICNVASVMAIGVLCDETALIDEAVDYFKNGPGNGACSQAVYFMHPGYLGQWQESGRDQSHSMLGIGLMGSLCEMAWNQGIDLYGYDNNRFLAGAEYVAKSNLIESGTSYYAIPYVPYNNVTAVNQNVFSTVDRGDIRPIWALIYHHYVSRKGLAAPYTEKYMQLVAPEGGGGHYGPNSGGFDHLGYGSLTHTRAAGSPATSPSGLTAYIHGGKVILSWWGTSNSLSYKLKRAVRPGGPYLTIATGITDLLSYTDSGMPDGTWYYVVTSVTHGGESAVSNEAAVTTGVSLHTRLLFDDGTGGTAADSSGNGRVGILSSTAAWTAGKNGGALGLNGTDAFVSLPANIMSDFGDFTISAWVFWNAARTWDRVFDFGSGAGRYMMLTARNANGVARFAITVSGRAGERFVDSNAALPRNAWFHLAVTLSGRACTMFVNGAVVGSNPNLFHAPFQIGPMHQNWLGRSQHSTQPFFNGKIDDFRIYRGALTGEQIVALMNDQVQYIDLSATTQIMQQGALYNRVTQKYHGGVVISNRGPSLAGPLVLRLTELSGAVTLENASGSESGTPVVLLPSGIQADASISVPLTFTNPSRGVISYVPKLYKNAF
jgi:hypothetical protein